jgi:hypothetical protein
MSDTFMVTKRKYREHKTLEGARHNLLACARWNRVRSFPSFASRACRTRKLAHSR